MRAANRNQAGGVGWRPLGALLALAVSLTGWQLDWWPGVSAAGIFIVYLIAVKVLEIVGILPPPDDRVSELRQMRIGGARSESKNSEENN